MKPLLTLLLIVLGTGGLAARPFDPTHPERVAAEVRQRQNRPRMPDLRQTDLETARGRLPGIGLQVVTADVPEEGVPGRVLTQVPPAGAPLENGQRVYLRVRTAPTPTPAPSEVDSGSRAGGWLPILAQALLVALGVVLVSALKGERGESGPEVSVERVGRKRPL